jgi:hypothetical protein
MTSHPVSLEPSMLTHLSAWGFPPSVLQRYAKSGVVALFQWQIECLLTDNAAPLQGGSLIYTAPTR